jgi:hypothetical protein
MTRAERKALRAGIVATVLLLGCGEPRSAAPPVDALDARADAPPPTEPPVWVPPEVVVPDPDSSEPFLLSQTGLYSDFARRTLAPDLIAFEPTDELWSDGADKRRWLRLPAGTRIDTSDPDHWIFPVGSMLWKEFSRDGVPLETRLIMRVGPGREDYFMGAFRWRDDDGDARFVPEGENDVRGSDHDVPKAKQCLTCHNGEVGRVLGMSAVQLPDAPPEILTQPAVGRFRVPGDRVAAEALGYLHANCGHCHNSNGTAWPQTGLDLRLSVSDATLEDTSTHRTAVDVAMDDKKLRRVRIVARDADASGVFHRMSLRGPAIQMPPSGTEHVDERGLAAVEAFIDSL